MYSGRLIQEELGEGGERNERISKPEGDEAKPGNGKTALQPPPFFESFTRPCVLVILPPSAAP